MSRTEVATVLSLLRGQPRGDCHRDRLEGFYAPQAAHYDTFRDRLLPGRAEMLEALCLEPGQHLVELGCGTARNLDYINPALRAKLRKVDAVDLCPSLLHEARARTRDWHNVEVVEADATDFDPGQPVGRVFFSYSITMIPNWREALRNAYRMLRPGGLIGVVDFCPATAAADKPSLARALDVFWQHWFSHDGVCLDRAHRAFLDGLFEPVCGALNRASVPYVPVMTVPYFIHVGRK